VYTLLLEIIVGWKLLFSAIANTLFSVCSLVVQLLKTTIIEKKKKILFKENF
jgi:hypothetical protein